MKLMISFNLLNKPKDSLWWLVTGRSNQMVNMKLKPKGSSDDEAFAVGTYHMPCMFREPKVMMVHCALSAQHLSKFAAGLPFVYCGDFNIKPESAMYV